MDEIRRAELVRKKGELQKQLLDKQLECQRKLIELSIERLRGSPLMLLGDVRIREILQPLPDEIEFLQKEIELIGIELKNDFEQRKASLASPKNIEAVQDGALVAQDDFIDKFKIACGKRNLRKKKTIPPNLLYEIAKGVGFSDLPDLEKFKDGNPAYHKARQYASITGYVKKRNANSET